MYFVINLKKKITLKKIRRKEKNLYVCTEKKRKLKKIFLISYMYIQREKKQRMEKCA